MPELHNFPAISQRDSDVNAEFDCVPAALASCISYLTGKRYTASAIKDAVYGASYVGGTEASRYVSFCFSQGVSLHPVNGSSASLVNILKNAIADGHPALITEPDPYLAGWSHVCAAFKFDDSSITVMDPWINAPVTQSDSRWSEMLQDNQVWILEKAMISIGDVANFFVEESPDTVWRSKSTGRLLAHGFLNYWRSLPAPLALAGLPVTDEIFDASHTNVSVQIFERIILCYDTAHVIDQPPNAGAIYALHLDSQEAAGFLALLSYLKIAVNNNGITNDQIEAISFLKQLRDVLPKI